ncbi:glycosyltransferase family A protein [Enterococcus casseliflavus]|uniref:glycosyltransferase family A protein n=1 Tax=Enterococcus casseliflavus TaxID=37734 RepID=UPI0029542DD1|nr:glycosyltransferase family A protein [Enterococcus casseliflavus]MDV7737547.1 glycosyltransferase family A protein [Enterococcus casseliflavus]
MSSISYNFTIIVSYRNTEEYLSKCILSVLKQSIGFEKKVQLILVNDHSSDCSKEIADFFAAKIPDQVLSIESKGNGVAAAKNTGLKFAYGKYINFLDSDDYLSNDALEKVSSFFDSHSDVPLVSIPMEYFENQNGPHMLNYKFENTRVINIIDEPSAIQLSSASSFFLKEAIDNQEFDEKMIFGEDSKFVTNIVLKYHRYGIIHDTTYFYRKRIKQNSSMQNTYSQEFYYSTFIDEFLLRMIDEYAVDGEIPRYLQNIVAYSIQWPLRQQDVPIGINKSILEKFSDKVRTLLSYIDDEILLNLKYISGYQKWYLLCLKKDLDFNNPPIKIDNDIPSIEIDGKIYESLDKLSLNIQSYDIDETSFYVVFSFVSKFSNDKLKFYKITSNEKIQLVPSIERTTRVLGKVVKEYVYLQLIYPLNRLSDESFSILVECDGYSSKIRLSMKAQKKIARSLKYKRLTVSLKYDSSERRFDLSKHKRFYDLRTISKNTLNKLISKK